MKPQKSLPPQTFFFIKQGVKKPTSTYKLNSNEKIRNFPFFQCECNLTSNSSLLGPNAIIDCVSTFQNIEHLQDKEHHSFSFSIISIYFGVFFFVLFCFLKKDTNNLQSLPFWT